jgi:hypothetical protein
VGAMPLRRRQRRNVRKGDEGGRQEGIASKRDRSDSSVAG